MPPVSASIAVSCRMSKARWAAASRSLSMWTLGVEEEQRGVEGDGDGDDQRRIGRSASGISGRRRRSRSATIWPMMPSERTKISVRRRTLGAALGRRSQRGRRAESGGSSLGRSNASGPARFDRRLFGPRLLQQRDDVARSVALGDVERGGAGRSRSRRDRRRARSSKLDDVVALSARPP